MDARNDYITHLMEEALLPPILKRFRGHSEEIPSPEYVGQGSQGMVFKFTYKERLVSQTCEKAPLLFVYITTHKIQFKKWKFRGAPVDEATRRFVAPSVKESRAFGRLCDVGENGTFAVQCHGWMHLSDAQMACLTSAYTYATNLNECTRWGIIKDFISEPPTLDDIPMIRSKLDIAKHTMLLPEDAVARNYQKTSMVGLGSAKTFPYP